MGSYTTRAISDSEYKELIKTIREGFIDADGITRRPNQQVATILVLESNLGCRLSDVVNLRVEDIKKRDNSWMLDITEKKTGKRRRFVVPGQIKKYIDDYCELKGISGGYIFNLSEQAVWKSLRLATAALGMDNVSSHSMRKRAGLKLYEKSGYDIALVSQFYQHSDAKITLQYLRRNSKQMESAISSMVSLA